MSIVARRAQCLFERSTFRVHPAKLIVMTTPIRDTCIGAEIAVVRDVLDAIQRADISAAMALVAHACN